MLTNSEVKFNLQNSLTLHKVLRQFKQQQKQKMSLVNKIKMFKSNQHKTQSRVLSLERHLSKVRQVKEQSKERKSQYRAQLQANKKIIAQKNNRKVEIEKEKQKVITARTEILKQKQKAYQTQRNKSKENEHKIIKNRQTAAREKKRLGTIIKDHEEQARTKTKEFHRKRIDSVKKQHLNQLQKLASINNKKQQELKQLRNLEQSMILQYSESVSSLRGSQHRSTQRGRRVRF